ncbi:MAG: NAD-dependent epimerase/dehydratase family protein [Ardenticatenaceae bacterium]|nr:NAD-dependent epimerase/dehydratase family protein [Ardenticatenaceae bacterium]
MNVFLTGGTGFVGGALLQALLSQGAAVTALTRRSPSQVNPSTPLLRWVEGDVTQPGQWTSQLTDHEVVVHAAGRLGAFGISEAEYVELHVEGTRRLMEAAGEAGVSRILYVSSPGVLGPTVEKPKSEEAPYGPTNPYERSKAAAEKLVLEMASTGAPIIIVRPEFLYGPGDLHVLGLFQAVATKRFFFVNGGRSYCHPTFIEDGVRGMMLALENGRAGEIYQIAGEKSVTFHQFIAAMAEAMAVQVPRLSLPRPLVYAGAAVLEFAGQLTGITPPLTRSAVDFFSTSYRFSWAKANEELGYRPQVSLGDGLRRTVAWYRENGYLT